MTLLAWTWALSVLSLGVSFTIFAVRCLARAVRWSYRRHRNRTHRDRIRSSSSASAHTQWQPALPPAPLVGEVAELERCVQWLIWALSRTTTPGEVTIAARATDPGWWATLARVRATIEHLSAASPELDLAAWCMAVVDIDHRTTGARP